MLKLSGQVKVSTVMEINWLKKPATTTDIIAFYYYYYWVSFEISFERFYPDFSCHCPSFNEKMQEIPHLVILKMSTLNAICLIISLSACHYIKQHDNYLSLQYLCQDRNFAVNVFKIHLINNIFSRWCFASLKQKR